MLVSEAITEIKAGSLHDFDDQVSAAQYLARISHEYRRLRRWLAVLAPDLCTQKVSGIAVTGSSITKATSLTDFERVVIVRRLEGGYYYPIGHETRMNAVICGSEAGTYEVEFVSGAPATITTGTTLDLPLGLEYVAIERCCAWVRQRHNEDIGRINLHTVAAEAILAEARAVLQQRGGLHGEGMIEEVSYSLCWFETPLTIEIRGLYK